MSLIPLRHRASHSVNLAKLVEETVEGCFIGQRARIMQGESDIGSFYSPPSAETSSGPSGTSDAVHVEAVIDIGMREQVSHVTKAVTFFK